MLAAAHPDDTAVVFAAEDGSETPISWRELEDRSNQVVDLFSGAWRDRGRHRRRGAAQHARAPVLDVRGRGSSGRRCCPCGGTCRTGSVTSCSTSRTREVVVATGTTPRPEPSRRDDIRATTDRPTDPPVEDHVPEYTRLVATSGATGTPKIVAIPSPGVMESDADRRRRCSARRRASATSRPRRCTTSTGGRICYNPLLQDCDVVLMERFDALAAADLIEKYRIVFACMVPTMLMRIARLPDLDARDFSSIETHRVRRRVGSRVGRAEVARARAARAVHADATAAARTTGS